MKKYYTIPALLFVVIISSFKYQDNKEDVKDYISVPGPVRFGNVNYNLAWSSHPADNYYKQEYLAKGDSLGHFNKMVLIDVLNDTVKPKDLVDLKLHDLAQRKKVDPVVNYNLIQSPDSSEYILDFVESEGTPKVDFVEWNVYRYKTFSDIEGHKGVLLFGMSIRAYGDKAPGFFGSLRDTRASVTNQLINFKIPPILIKDN